jgi:hypothetical protein
MRVGVVLCLLFATTVFGQSKGYRYDNGGNVVEVLPLGTNANCASVGDVCSVAQRCFSGHCCQPTTCQYATCDSIDDGCGQFISCGTCASDMSCVGQQCFTQSNQSTAAENNATGELSILASKWDVEVQVQFVASKGAFASAMIMDPRAAVQSQCPINGGVDDCVNDTFTCRGCPQDPNSGPGEISCWCVNPAPLVYNNIPAGGSMSFRSNLLIDKDLDQYSDVVRTSASRIGPPGAGDRTGEVRYHEIISNVWRYEWEDLETAPNGDYNDYIGQLTFKDCDGTRFTPTLTTWPAPQGDLPTAMSCQDGCNVSFCGDPNESEPPELRLAAKVMVDNVNSEVDREGRGRMLTLSVVVQSDAVQDMAICPVLRVPYEPGISACGNVQMQEYTDDPSTACVPNRVTPTTTGIEPVCVQEVGTPCEMFPISVAREQVYGPNSCQSSGPYSRSGDGDLIRLEQGTACGAQSRVLDYELWLDDVDKTLQVDSLAARGNRLLDDPDVAVDSVELYVFDKLDPKIPFHCPSGVNVDFESYADQGVRVRKFTLQNKARHPAVDPLRELFTELR